MTAGDLFAGIGGMSLGLERAGMTVRWQVEVDPYAESVLERHWPDVVRRRDVRFAGPATLERVDLIAGGFPCQDISAAGRGAGIEAGRRSGLWREFARIVRELRPRWVLVENVPALRRRGADIVLGDLEAAGYACWPLVVGARHVGAPHRRDRVWIVARLADAACERTGEPDGQAQSERCGERWPAWEQAQCGGEERGVADASGDALRQQSGRGGGSLRAEAGEPRADGLAHGHGHGRKGERRGGLLDGERAAFGDDAHRFPARPGMPQWPWEQPRTVESPLVRAAHGVSARLAGARWRNELKALGNAVVPQCVELIARAITEVDSCSSS